jgi:hypothetical protein
METKNKIDIDSKIINLQKISSNRKRFLFALPHTPEDEGFLRECY